MKTHLKTKFINNIWITGIFNGDEIIGRTAIINNEEKVVLVTESASVNIVLYSEIQSICKINFVDKTKKQNNNLSRQSVMESFKLNLNKLYTQN